MSKTVKVPLRLVGPLKRTTIDPQSSDPVEEATTDVLHWLWSTRLQINRLTRSLEAELQLWNRGPRVRALRRFSATSYDEHMLVVAARNLDRALTKAARHIRPKPQLSKSQQRALSLLRDIYEHWNEIRREYRRTSGPMQGAAAKLKKEFPGAKPWSVTFDTQTGEVTVADVIPLGPFTAELRSLEARLLRLQRQRGSKTGNQAAVALRKSAQQPSS